MKSTNLSRKLSSLFWGELFSCIIFPILYFLWNNLSIEKINWITIWIILMLTIILLEGSLYWRITLNRVREISVVSKYTVGKIYYTFKLLNIAFLIFSIILIIFSLTISTTSQIAMQLFFYFFSLIEYINYFHTRLSYYGKKKRFFQIKKPIKILFSKKKSKSHIAKDISYYKNNK